MTIRLPKSNAVSQSQWTINIANISAYFTSFEGGKETLERARYMDGISAAERVAASGVQKVEDVTVSIPLDFELADELLTAVEDWKCSDEYQTVVLTAVDRCDSLQQKEGTKTLNYVNCRLLSRDFGSMSGDGTDVSMLTLSFSAEQLVLK